ARAQRLGLLPCPGIPDTHILIACGRQPFAIRTEGNTRRAAPFTGELLKLAVVREIPDAEERGFATGQNEPLAVRGKCKRVHIAVAANLDLAKAFASVRLPEAHDLAIAGRYQRLAVGSIAEEPGVMSAEDARSPDPRHGALRQRIAQEVKPRRSY